MRPEYLSFLASKAAVARERGLENVPELAPHLFPFQRLCTEFALRVGSSGCFLDTGLGKTEIELEFCQKAIEASNCTAIIWTPLAVAKQTHRRAERWGYEARVIREQSNVKRGVINICNYDRYEKIDAATFGAAAFDEASIFKSFNGVTRRDLTDAYHGCRFLLPATATPAPNDHMELGSYAELLGIMAANEMLSRFFINDTSTASQSWRLKSHGIAAFWDWMASWTRMAEKPSDLGDSDEGFILPPFEIIRHATKDGKLDQSFAEMFGMAKMSATSLHDVKRETSEARAEAVGTLVEKEMAEPWILWCDTDYEADALKAAMPWVDDVRGSHKTEYKEEILEAFATGQIKHLIGKPSMCGLGMDWSHCARMAFVGRSYSYETWYQAVRRCWRFGQKRNVKVHLVVAEGEQTIGRVIDRKADDHAKMKEAMRNAMLRATGQSAVVKAPYLPTHIARLAPWISAA